MRHVKKNQMPPDLSEALGVELSKRDWDRLIEIDDQRVEAYDRVWREVRDEFLRREEEYKQAKSEE